MTTEERIDGVEDAVILLTNILEEKSGPIHQWMASVTAHRASEQA
jgi:hypothetical protein